MAFQCQYCKRLIQDETPVLYDGGFLHQACLVRANHDALPCKHRLHLTKSDRDLLRRVQIQPFDCPNCKIPKLRVEEDEQC